MKHITKNPVLLTLTLIADMAACLSTWKEQLPPLFFQRVSYLFNYKAADGRGDLELQWLIC